MPQVGIPDMQSVLATDRFKLQSAVDQTAVGADIATFLRLAGELELAGQWVLEKQHIAAGSGEVQNVIFMCEPNGGLPPHGVEQSRLPGNRHPVLKPISKQNFRSGNAAITLHRDRMRQSRERSQIRIVLRKRQRLECLLGEFTKFLMPYRGQCDDDLRQSRLRLS